MVLLQGLTNVSVLLVYFGLAGVWGKLLGRGLTNRLYMLISLIFGVALFLPSSIWLPWGWSARFAAWILALGLVVVFATQPGSLPGWMWSYRFGLVYFGAMMLLTVVWAFFTQQTMQWTGLGLSALLIGLLIVMRTLAEYGASSNNSASKNRRI